LRILAALIFFTAFSFLLFSLSPINHEEAAFTLGLYPKSTPDVSLRAEYSSSAISKLLNTSEFKKNALPEIQDALRMQLTKGQLPLGLSNVVQVDWEANIEEISNDRIKESLLLIAKLREKSNSAPPSKLFCSIVHEKNQVMVLLSLEDVRSKNRIWELGISIKKNPTKSL
jgi:hypothetical protein